MLQDLDKTLENILRVDGKIPKKDVEIEFDTPTREWSSKLSRPTVNCWAFDVRENVKLRRPDYPRRPDGRPTASRSVTMSRPPRRMDVSYLVTAWARKPEDEHALLWRTLRTFKGFLELPAERREGELAYSDFQMPMIVADMSQQTFNMTDLWSVLDNEIKLGFIVVVTMELEIDRVIETPLVLSATFGVSQIEADGSDSEEEEKPPITTERKGELDDKALTERFTRTEIDTHFVHRAETTEDES